MRLPNPRSTAALADRVTAGVVRRRRRRRLVDDVLPGSLDRLAPTIAGGLQAAVNRGLTEAFSNPEVQEIITNLVRRAHAAAMRLLEGDGLVDGITVVDGAVTLNLLPLIDRGLTRLQSFGLLSDVELPTMTADGDPDAADRRARSRRSAGTCRRTSVSSSSTRATASPMPRRRWRAPSARSSSPSGRCGFCSIATVALIALTIVVARNRWRAALLLGLGTVAAIVIARTGVRRRS